MMTGQLHAQPPVANDPIESATRQAVGRGLAFLSSVQGAEGAWRAFDRPHPAVTALAVQCFVQDERYGDDHPIARRGLDYVLRHVQPDGGIYVPEEGMRNYHTSVALMALAATGNPTHKKTIQQAQVFLKKLQWDEGEGHERSSDWYGGVGYGRGKRPDLSNTQLMIEALKQSGLPDDDPVYRKALTFVARCQMLGEANDQPFAVESVDESAVDPLSVTIIGSFDELAAVAEEWDNFVERSGSDIYFVTDWLEAWWTYYGKNRTLRCFLIQKDGATVAALPFFIQTIVFGPLRLKVARFVGADFTIPVFIPPIAKNHEIEVLAYVFRYLFSTERCDCVSLTPLSAASLVTAAVREIGASNKGYQLARDDSAISHTNFLLPDNFDGYLKKLSRKTRSNFRRNMRRLSARCELEHRTLRGSEAPLYFSKFINLHQERWTNSGKLGHFGDWPASVAFNRDVVQRLARKDQARIYMLVDDGEPLSIQYGFVLGDRCYWRLPARHADPEYEKFGLGGIGLIKMLESLIDEGIRLVEAGPGYYNYKIEYGGEEFALRRLVVTRSSMFTRQKMLLFLLWSDLIDIIYYRIWFKKMTPKIPFFKYPLWRTWIRTRL